MSTPSNQVKAEWQKTLPASAVKPNLMTIIQFAQSGSEVTVEVDTPEDAVELLRATEKLMKEENIIHSLGQHYMFRVAQDDRPGSPMLGSIRFRTATDENMTRLQTQLTPVSNKEDN